MKRSRLILPTLLLFLCAIIYWAAIIRPRAQLTPAPVPATVAWTGASSSIGGSLLAAGACSSTTVSTPGATAGMVADANPATYPGDGTYWLAYVSGTDTVTVKVCAAVLATPNSSAYNIRLFK